MAPADSLAAGRHPGRRDGMAAQADKWRHKPASGALAHTVTKPFAPRKTRTAEPLQPNRKNTEENSTGLHGHET